MRNYRIKMTHKCLIVLQYQGLFSENFKIMLCSRKKCKCNCIKFTITLHLKVIVICSRKGND